MLKRNTFSREFKLEAIRQMEAGDKKAADLASELGVPRNKLYQLSVTRDKTIARKVSSAYCKIPLKIMAEKTGEEERRREERGRESISRTKSRLDAKESLPTPSPFQKDKL